MHCKRRSNDLAGPALLLVATLLLTASAVAAQPRTAALTSTTSGSETYQVELEDRVGAEAVLGVPAMTPVALVAFPGEALSALPDDLGENALFGTLRHGGPDGVVSIIVDPRPDGSERVFIDQNDDEDLSNDPALHWDGDFGMGEVGDAILPTLETECQIVCPDGERVPVALRLQRYDRDRVKGRMGAVALRNGVLATVETYRQGRLVIDDERAVEVALVPTVLAGRHTLFAHPSNALVVDLNGDGTLDGRPMRSPERFRLGAPFQLDGRAFKVVETSCDGRRLEIAEIDPTLTAARRSRARGLVLGQPAPEFSLASIAGDTVRLDAYRGKVVLLDFWATWCAPCRYEMPYVKRAYERFHDQGFEIIGISLDTGTAIVERYTEQFGMPWPQILQPRGTMTALKASYGVRSIPSAFLIDADGMLVASGGALRGERLIHAVEELVSNGGRRSD
jgi:peroxiredoxin